MSVENRLRALTVAAFLLSSAVAVGQTVADTVAEPSEVERTPAERGATIGLRTAALPAEVRAQIVDAVPPSGGLLVTHVVPRSPADRAGVERYDVLLTANEEPLARPEDLEAVVADAEIGAALAIALVRGGRPSEVTITVERRAAPPAGRQETIELQRAALPFSGQRADTARTARTGIALADGPITERAILVTTADGRTFDVTVTSDAERWSWSTTPAPSNATPPKTTSPETTPENVSPASPSPGVPAVHRERVATLIAGIEAERSRGVFRFRVQPRADGRDRSVVLLVQQPGESGEYRVLEVERRLVGDALPVDELLDVESLDGELDRLAPGVRVKLEAALHRYRVPPVRARVRRPQ